MKAKFCLALIAGAFLLVVQSTYAQEELPRPFPHETVNRLAALALHCVHREYPNKVSHVMQSDEDVLPPRELYPMFYGCYDWHSSVHGHWMLARLSSKYPELAFAARAPEVLAQSFTAKNIAGELAYFNGKGRASFERPYGMAWFLQLMGELREWDMPQAQQWCALLQPLETAISNRIKQWLPNLAYPIRGGEHFQTAFAFGLIYDWSLIAGDKDMSKLIRDKSVAFYQSDTNCPLSYEPSGHDFLSSCWAEADLMRRLLDQKAFAKWLHAFLRAIPESPSVSWFEAVVVTDPGDPKLAHLDGLNLSRSWMLNGVSASLPANDKRKQWLDAAATRHLDAGLVQVTGEHYEGGHWLASFATYAFTRRGVGRDR